MENLRLEIQKVIGWENQKIYAVSRKPSSDEKN
jgi:hypothetical protein